MVYELTGAGNAYVYSADSSFPPANERWRYFVTTSLIGWVQAQNQPHMYQYTLPTLVQ